MQLVHEIMKFNTGTQQSLITSIYPQKKKLVLVLWYIVFENSFADLPVPILCEAIESGLVSNGVVRRTEWLFRTVISTNKLDLAFHSWSFYPSMLKIIDSLDPNEIHSIYPAETATFDCTSLVEDIKVVRREVCSRDCKERCLSRPWQAHYQKSEMEQCVCGLDKCFESFVTRTQTSAAIIKDDLERLTLLAAHPTFEMTTETLSVAARHCSFNCFRFLLLNRCPFTQAVFDWACEGGDEEIIQICLENGASPSDSSLEHAIMGFQNHVCTWLVEIHEIIPTYVHLQACFRSGNMMYLWVLLQTDLNVLFSRTTIIDALNFLRMIHSFREETCKVMYLFFTSNQVDESVKNEWRQKPQTPMFFFHDAQSLRDCGLLFGNKLLFGTKYVPYK